MRKNGENASQSHYVTVWILKRQQCDFFRQNTSTLAMSAVDVMTESSQSAARHQNPSALLPMHRNEVIRTVSEGNPCCVLQPRVTQFYL